MAAAGTIFALATVVGSVSPASASTAGQALAAPIISMTDVPPVGPEGPPVEPPPTPEPPLVEEPSEPLPPGEVPPADPPPIEPPPADDEPADDGPAETPPSDTAGEEPAPSADPGVEPLPNVPPSVDAPPPAVDPVPPSDSGNESTCCDAPGTEPPIDIDVPVLDPPLGQADPPPALTDPTDVGDPVAEPPAETAAVIAAKEVSGATAKDEPSAGAAAGAASRESVEAAQAAPAAKPNPPTRDSGRSHRPIPDAAAGLDGAAAASAGIAAGLAVVNRAPAGVAVAIEFGRLGGGWAGAIVFNLWLRRQLSSRRMSQRQLAALSGVDHTTISRLLREDRHPSLTTATKIVRALRGVPPEAAEPATADYFDRMPDETVFPARRVELALRADDQLDDEQVRRLMTLYLNARRRGVAASRGDPESVEANGRTTVAPGSRR